MEMKDWTDEHWENLERLSNKLNKILKEPKYYRNNRAWQAELRMTIRSINDYYEAPRWFNDKS